MIKNVAAAQRLAGDAGRGQKTVGGERLQSLAAERFDVSRGVRRLQQPRSFCDGSFWPLREAAAEEDLCVLSGSSGGKYLGIHRFGGMFRGGGREGGRVHAVVGMMS